MRLRSYHTIALAIITLLMSASTLRAQESVTDSLTVRSIFDELALIKEGEGTVFITQSPDIAALVHNRPTLITKDDLQAGYTYRSGYRIQVFSSNDTNARSTASYRAQQLKDAFPEIETDVLYKAPFWSVRTGSFVTREEARDFIDSLKGRFPAFAREMYVVPSKIKVPL